jgi:hypothetical protein
MGSRPWQNTAKLPSVPPALEFFFYVPADNKLFFAFMTDILAWLDIAVFYIIFFRFKKYRVTT